MAAPFPIVDAHQHFWGPRVNYRPWLCDQPPIPFRYGDYSHLRRPYLPADYFADAGPHPVVKTVYVETEWDPGDPVGEMRYVERLRRDLPAIEQRAFFHDNAIRIYDMERT
jgi:predicted TIM-barrel fold metal-dependent hydrolase